jgi:hypothetical protein
MSAQATTPSANPLTIEEHHNPILLPKPPKPLEKQLAVANTNFAHCVKKEDPRQALHWAIKRNHIQKLVADSRNGERSSSQCHSQESQAGGRSQEGPRGRHEGPGVPRNGEAHIRWSEEVRPDEDQEGSHRQQEEARAGQEGAKDTEEGRLRGEEGHI